MRSDAVSLEVPVKVHGSRVNDATSGAAPNSEPFEEQTSTMIVFPQGSVLKMATPVTAGQMIVVTNLKSGHDSICRIVKVRAYAPGQSYVEIEFTHRQAGYWGVYFPSDGPEVAHHVAPVTPAAPGPISVDRRIEKTGERSAPEASALQSAPKPPTAKPAGSASKPDSVFAPIGSQEQVQPAASATSSRVKPSSISGLETKPLDFETVMKSPAIDSLPMISPSPAASISIGELQGDVEVAPAFSFTGAGVPGEVAEASPTHSARPAEQSAPLGRLATTATLGGGLGASTLGMGGHAPESSQSKASHGVTISVSAVALLAVAAGASYYFNWLSFGHKSGAKPATTVLAPAAASPIAEATAPTNLVQQPVNPASSPSAQVNPVTAPEATSAAVASAPSARMNPTAPAPPRPSKPTPLAAALEPAPATRKPEATVPDMFGALNAHPTSRAYSADSGQEEAAPAVDAPTVESGAAGLSEIAASSAIAAPSAAPQAPVRIRVGGEVKPPRLVSSVLPVYPVVARDAGIEGDVVVDTTIDTTGKVTGTKVISGLPMFRQAALDAVQQWKYEPSKLNGEPVSVEMTVTIKFHRP